MLRECHILDAEGFMSGLALLWFILWGSERLEGRAKERYIKVLESKVFLAERKATHCKHPQSP